MSNNELKLIIDPPQSGVINMAVDQDILNSVDAGESGPVLRFYRWQEPTISLGYFQKDNEVEDLDVELQKLPVVRRITGGGAILHDIELTYSLILPLERAFVGGNVNDLYSLVHDIMIKLLNEAGIEASYRGFTDPGNSQRGPFFCFARNHSLDIVTPDGKLLGSAQRRLKNAVLQHGSLILEKRYSQQPGACTGADFDCGKFVNSFYSELKEKLGLDSSD